MSRPWGLPCPARPAGGLASIPLRPRPSPGPLTVSLPVSMRPAKRRLNDGDVLAPTLKSYQLPLSATGQLSSPTEFGATVASTGRRCDTRSR
jgi:hypothetical protein